MYAVLFFVLGIPVYIAFVVNFGQDTLNYLTLAFAPISFVLGTLGFIQKRREIRNSRYPGSEAIVEGSTKDRYFVGFLEIERDGQFILIESDMTNLVGEKWTVSKIYNKDPLTRKIRRGGIPQEIGRGKRARFGARIHIPSFDLSQEIKVKGYVVSLGRTPIKVSRRRAEITSVDVLSRSITMKILPKDRVKKIMPANYVRYAASTTLFIAIALLYYDLFLKN
ncbi:hypothetical protein ACFL9T_04640 [Thermodesulfobacteriota bacterium]